MSYGATLRGILGARSSGGLFTVTAYNGIGSSQNVATGQNLSANSLLWLKDVTAAENHLIFDETLEAAGTYLQINGTAEEQFGDLVDLTTGGFTAKTNATYNASRSYAAFSWVGKQGFFNVTSYTGDSNNGRAIAHGLNAVPAMMIVKRRTGGMGGWAVYHKDNTANPETEIITLNSPSGTADSSLWWNDTAPDASEFTVADNAEINNSGDDYEAFLFAEKAGLSDFGTYTGDGSSSNAVTGLGFKPSMVLTKRTDSSGDWGLHYNDNGTVYYLVPNATNARSSALMSLDGNGFTLNSAVQNVSAATYIYAAWR